MLAGRRIACAVYIGLGGFFLLAHSLFISTEVHFCSILHFVSCIIIRFPFYLLQTPFHQYLFLSMFLSLPAYYLFVKRFHFDLLVQYIQFETYYRSNWPNLLTILTLTSSNFFYLQLDAQNFYLFTYNTFIKILYMFRALSCSSSGGLRRNCIYAASGIVTL
jgi:hypothetical protein